jgi:tyrosyl-tRNA synthetase
MSELMQREFITERMNTGISYAEFSYSLVQGYDYWQLYKKHTVVLQIGGSDQWGNMLSGVSLIRKKEAKEAHALSMPLVVNKATGKKFGKSEDGAVWLDPKKTSPAQFYQFWINVDDDDVEDYLKIFTLLSRDKIETLMKDHKQSPQERLAQEDLAFQVTKLVHGEKQAHFAEKVADLLTGRLKIYEPDEASLKEVRPLMPSVSVQPGSSVMEVLVQTGLASSNSDARRLMQAKSIYVNDQKFDKPHLDSADFKKGRLMLRRGKAYKDTALVELV